MEIRGSGFGLGVGLHYFVNNNFAFRVGDTHSIINISKIKLGSFFVEVDEDGRSRRLGLDFPYHF